MPNLNPISDQMKDSAVRPEITISNPIYLTKNEAMLKLLSELEKGRKWGEEKGWILESEVRNLFLDKEK